MQLGWCEICLNVRSIDRSLAFYTELGFRQVGGSVRHGWAVLAYGACRIALYEGHIDRNMLNFRGGDVEAIARMLKEKGIALASDASREADGSVGATVEDPDGNLLYFNTHPDEAPAGPDGPVQ